jgi:hypothetical protein
MSGHDCIQNQHVLTQALLDRPTRDKKKPMQSAMRREAMKKRLMVIIQVIFWTVLSSYDVYARLATSWYVSYGGTSRWEEINIAYEDQLSKFALGDFDGDGKTDVFYTAPGGIWLVSYSGTGRWEKINEFHADRADIKELAFGDFDGDGKTDVFHRPPDSRDWLVSYGGTGRWEKINESKASIDEIALGDFDGDGKTDVFYLGIPSRPNAPSKLRITEVGDRALTVTWQDNSDREDGVKVHWVGEREGYTSHDLSSTLKKPNIKSHSEKNLREGFRYCISVQAFNRSWVSLFSNEDCETIPISEPPPPTPPSPTGVSQLAVFNCHYARRIVHVWTFDLTAGTWSEHGTLADQWSNGSCPAGASPLLIPLTDSHSYRLVAVDPSLIGCNGRNNPEHPPCQKLFTGAIRGDDDGRIFPVTVN